MGNKRITLTRWVALTESRGSNRFLPAPTGSITEPKGILLMKLSVNVTSAEDFLRKKKVLKVVVYSSSRDPEHIRYITFVQKTVVQDIELV